MRATGPQRIPPLAAQLVGALALTFIAAVPSAAQTRPRTTPQKKARGYISISGGAHTATGTLRDRFVYTVNVEDATTEARYPRKAGALVDAGAGMLFWRNIGAAIHVAYSSVSGSAQTESQIPHPFFDDRNRQVSGKAGDLTRAETAAHLQFYYLRAFRSWRVRLEAGPSYFNVEQDVVTGVTVDEEFPFDTATFRNATTKGGRGTAPGFNVGADVTWMFTPRAGGRPRTGVEPRLGVGMLVRFTRATVDFNVDGTHRVSTDAGGAQAAAGIRVTF